MAGSSFGNIFRITTWGESHGKGIGVVVDGCPAGLQLCEEDIQKYLDRRKPGQSKFTTTWFFPANIASEETQWNRGYDTLFFPQPSGGGNTAGISTGMF